MLISVRGTSHANNLNTAGLHPQNRKAFLQIKYPQVSSLATIALPFSLRAYYHRLADN